jgi:hypothetical protein
MTQAKRVHSTQPTNTSATNPTRPVDPTRRGFIALAAGAGIISVGSLAAVAMPISATPVSDVPIATGGAPESLCDHADRLCGAQEGTRDSRRQGRSGSHPYPEHAESRQHRGG